ncbi:beta-ketoacyl-ACP synthase [Cyanobacterium stanieri LEGE 03274]|uniref:Beta-ketoacyl-ACP synthase n=1 Tax=Cyanobacterium stanieri LEGE 03274 TaxID=1828756 RepID=A0ABR9V349_9CHRO|nr:beta-ketoacyl-ACP synthase [Cyanobacterium stanieri]MBE9222325.1 beta-ketoacyl-ACP synthase [Cyanobacterium stanieri LEGE 03274]
MKVVVSGVGLISCLGDTQTTWDKMSKGLSGIKLSQPYDFLSAYPLGLINQYPSNIEDITLKVIRETLKSAHLSFPLPDMGVVVGSSRGCQGSWEIFAREWLQNQCTPTDWLKTFPCQPSTITAQYVGSFAPVFAPMGACATGIGAIAQGYELIKQGHCQRVIAGAVEAPITPLTIVGFEKMKALANTGCYPFALERQGMVLGEGGAMIILETEESARGRGATIYGEIKGWGSSCDAQAMTAPEESADSAIYAIKQCLARSNLSIKDIDHIQTHGTATQLNDHREALLIEKIFSHYPKINHTKAAIGHTLGASGAIATTVTLLSLHQQKLLLNYQPKKSEYPLNWVEKTENYSFKNSLCFSFGFGGQNAIIALSKYEN